MIVNCFILPICCAAMLAQAVEEPPTVHGKATIVYIDTGGERLVVWPEDRSKPLVLSMIDTRWWMGRAEQQAEDFKPDFEVEIWYKPALQKCMTVRLVKIPGK